MSEITVRAHIIKTRKSEIPAVKLGGIEVNGGDFCSGVVTDDNNVTLFVGETEHTFTVPTGTQQIDLEGKDTAFRTVTLKRRDFDPSISGWPLSLGIKGSVNGDQLEVLPAVKVNSSDMRDALIARLQRRKAAEAARKAAAEKSPAGTVNGNRM